MGSPVRSHPHRDSHLQELRRIRHRLAAVAERAVAGLHPALLHKGHLLIGKDQAVRSQEITAKHLHFLQVFIRAHAFPLDDSIHLAHVLVHMGLKHGAPLLCVSCLQFNQAVGTGVEGAQGIVYLQVSISMEPVIQGIRALYSLLRIHCNGFRKPILIHGGIGKGASKPASCINPGRVFHIIASGVNKSGCT